MTIGKTELALTAVGVGLGLFTEPEVAMNLMTLEMVIPRPMVDTVHGWGDMVLARIPRRTRSTGNDSDRLASV